MTKQDEIEILNRAIQELGADSYIGPWLSQVRDGVEHDIRSDYFPVITLADAERRASEIIDMAKADRESILASAREEKEKIEKRTDEIRQGIWDSLRRAQHAMNDC
jgi:hypothetical protein